MMASNKSDDDDRDARVASTKNKPSRKARRWRQALEAFDRQQLLNEYGLTLLDLLK